MEHESDGDTNCNWCTRYCHRRCDNWTGGLGNKRASGNHPNESIIKLGQNTWENPKDLERLDVTETYAGVKNSQMRKIIMIIIIIDNVKFIFIYLNDCVMKVISLTR